MMKITLRMNNELIRMIASINESVSGAVRKSVKVALKKQPIDIVVEYKNFVTTTSRESTPYKVDTGIDIKINPFSLNAVTYHYVKQAYDKHQQRSAVKVDPKDAETLKRGKDALKEIIREVM